MYAFLFALDSEPAYKKGLDQNNLWLHYCSLCQGAKLLLLINFVIEKELEKKLCMCDTHIIIEKELEKKLCMCDTHIIIEKE